MRALILAAGRGERMRPLTDATAKPLLMAGGKRLIEWQVEALVGAGIRDIVINTAHLPQQFEEVLGSGARYGARLAYSREGERAEEALETLGGIVRALPHLGSKAFLVASGDIVTDYPYARLVERAAELDAGAADAHLVLIDNPAFHPNGDMALAADRVDPDGLAAQEDERIVRKHGEALVPFLRLDTMYQEVETDVTARDYLIIVGYGAVGFQVRSTVYEEKEPPDKLRLAEYHALYRMSLGNHVEIDLGAGAMVLKGIQENSGFSVTVPVLIHPSDHYGFEFRPVWSSINENDIQDFDVAVLFGWRYVSVKAGYRWVRSPHQSLDGPEMGVSLRW